MTSFSDVEDVSIRAEHLVQYEPPPSCTCSSNLAFPTALPKVKINSVVICMLIPESITRKVKTVKSFFLVVDGPPRCTTIKTTINGRYTYIHTYQTIFSLVNRMKLNGIRSDKRDPDAKQKKKERN
ncbi:uncharacterized protein VTP21DRAFT_9792 [Calcarisporiella thermophila]|uniref:uncharacterized protein n=1 Tax=Calcarisporiella thermophila TaxID=911321 RepID=UPI003743D7D1